jgi:hypothetical protein
VVTGLTLAAVQQIPPRFRLQVLSVILLTLTFLVNWALTWIQQRGRA